VQLDHLLCHRGHGLTHLRLLLGPVLAPHPGHPRCLPARVAPHSRQLVDRYVETVLSGIGDDQIVPFDPGHRPGDEALEAADAVLVMHDVVALGQVTVLLGSLAPGPAGPSMGAAAAGDLLLPQDRSPDARGDEAAMDPERDDGRTRGLETVQTIDGQALLGQGRRHPVGGGHSVHRHHDVDLPGQ
jgi:hypothetical protein